MSAIPDTDEILWVSGKGYHAMRQHYTGGWLRPDTPWVAFPCLPKFSMATLCVSSDHKELGHQKDYFHPPKRKVLTGL